MNLVTHKQSVTTIDHIASGQRMRKWRERLKISVRQAAKSIGISAAFLSDLERGRRNWTVEKHAKLVAYYGQKESK